MAKKATTKQTAVMFVARRRRSEIDGNKYEIGDETDLAGLTDQQIGYVVGNHYYDALNPELLSEAQLAEIKKNGG